MACDKCHVIILSKCNSATVNELYYLLNEKEIKFDYFDNITVMLDHILKINKGIVFVDSSIKPYLKIILQMMAHALLSKYIVIFLDNDNIDEYLPYCDDLNFFAETVQSLKKNFDKIKNIYMRKCLYQENTEYVYGLKTFVSDQLIKFGFSYKYIGFQYLKQCVVIIVHDNCLNFSLQKRIYPTIASKNNSTSYAIERNIRIAIEKAYQKNKEVFDELFDGEKICNKSLISYLVNYTQNHFNKNIREVM